MLLSHSHRRSALAVAGLLFAALLLAPETNVRADITYNLINYPAYQNGWNFPGGWNMSGTIITDGNMGALAASDIKGWSWTATNGTYTYSANSTQAGTSLGYMDVGSAYATPNYIAIPLGSDGEYGFDLSSSIPPPAPYSLGGLNYQLNTHTNSVLTALYWYNFSYVPEAPWWTDWISPVPNEVSTPLGNAWEVANGGTPTPEPSTLVLLGSALLGLGAFYLRRRRANA